MKDPNHLFLGSIGPISERELLLASITTGFILFLHTVYNYMFKSMIQQHLEKAKSKTPFDPIIPMLPHSHPIFGHFISETSSPNITDIPSLSISLLKQYSYKGMSSYWFGPTRTLIVFDPKAAKTILENISYRKVPHIAKKHLSRFTSEKNILMLNGKEWRLYRSAIHRSITSNFLKEYQHSMIEYAYKLTTALKEKIDNDGRGEGGEDAVIHENIKPLMQMLTMDIFFSVSMGMDLKSCEKLQMSKIGQIYEASMKDFSKRLFIHPLRPWNYFYSIPSIDNIKLLAQQFLFGSTIERHIQARKNAPRKEKFQGKNKDMLSNILMAQERGGASQEDAFYMSNNDFRGMVKILLGAGFETTSTTLLYTFYNISSRPDVEKLLLEEINDVIGNGDDNKQDFDVDKLVLCKSVINESLRLYPIAHFTSRSILQDQSIDINGVKFCGPEFLIRIPIWSIHRDINNFPRPDEFLPERWCLKTSSNKWVERFPGDDSNEEKQWTLQHSVPPANREAFFAFSSGARNCVGKKFAYQEAVIILAVMIKELKLEVEDGYACTPVRSGLTQSPKLGMPMKISRRRHL